MGIEDKSSELCFQCFDFFFNLELEVQTLAEIKAFFFSPLVIHSLVLIVVWFLRVSEFGLNAFA